MNDWQKQISRWSASELVDLLGCGLSTAYAWLDGKRQPPAWLQPVIMGELNRRHGKPERRFLRDSDIREIDRQLSEMEAILKRGLTIKGKPMNEKDRASLSKEIAELKLRLKPTKGKKK